MTDITVCDGAGCPIRKHCYRNTAARSTRQSWFAETPGYWLTEQNCTIESERGKWECDYYIPHKLEANNARITEPG